MPPATARPPDSECVYSALTVDIEDVIPAKKKRRLCDTVSNAIRTVIKILCSFIFGLILLTLVPSCLLCLLPLYLLRWFVKKIAPFFRPDLEKILNSRGATLSVDNIYSGIPKCNLFVLGIVDGKLPLKVFHDNVRRMLRDKHPDGSQLNAEMEQYITSWLGYHFWKREENFVLEDHVRMYDGIYLKQIAEDGGVTEKTLNLLANELIRTPFRPRTSPWEAFLLHDIILDDGDPVNKPKSVLILRIHHSLADGFSVLKLITKDLMGAHYERAEAAFQERSMCEKIFGTIWLALKSPFEGAAQIIEAVDFNDWHIAEDKLSFDYNIAATKRLPLDYIKGIKNKFRTPFTAVLLAAMAAGVRKSMIVNGARVPRKIHCLTPLPMPGHPPKLRNHLTLCVITLPVGEEDPIQRLRAIRADLDSQKTSSIPLTLFLLAPLFGALPAWLVRLTFHNYATTTVLTSMPGPDRVIDFLGCPLDDVVFGGGMLAGNCGIGLSSLSYNNAIRFGTGVDKSILDSSDKVEQIVQFMLEELELLKKISESNESDQGI